MVNYKLALKVILILDLKTDSLSSIFFNSLNKAFYKTYGIKIAHLKFCDYATHKI